MEISVIYKGPIERNKPKDSSGGQRRAEDSTTSLFLLVELYTCRIGHRPIYVNPNLYIINQSIIP